MGSRSPPPKSIVLVIEDEPLLLLHAIGIIEDAGLLPLSAHTTDEAVTLLAQREDIQIVFSDIGLPGSMNGIALAAYIRQRWPLVKLILTSGQSAPAPGELPVGARFFSKPVDPERLVGLLCEFCEQG